MSRQKPSMRSRRHFGTWTVSNPPRTTNTWLTELSPAFMQRQMQSLLCHRTNGRASYPGVWELPGDLMQTQEEESRAALDARC